MTDIQIFKNEQFGDRRGFFTTSRGKNRAKTFPGIAEAMAKQWGDYILREYEYDNA